MANKLKVPNGSIFVADTWRRTQLAEHLLRYLTVQFLPDLNVDFHLSEDTAVIFISEADLISGNGYRRRVVKFRKDVDTVKGVVVAQKTHLTVDHFSSIQRLVVIELGLTIIPVNTIEEAGQLLVQMVNCQSKINANPFRMKAKPASTPDASLIKCVSLIPGLGEKKSILLLNHFGSLKSIANASPESLADIVGTATASLVHNFFNSQNTFSR